MASKRTVEGERDVSNAFAEQAVACSAAMRTKRGEKNMQVNPGTGNAVKSILQGEVGQRLESALVGFKRGDAYREGFPKLDEKYGAAQRLNSQWGGGVLLAQWVGPVEKLAEKVKEKYDKDMKEHKDKLDKIDKQNKETNQNVEHINRELDRISREMKEKASQKDSGK